MAQIVILCDRFYAIRKLLRELKYHKHRGNGRESFNSEYERKRNRKYQQQQLFKEDVRFKEFFKWVFSIQERLKIDGKEFAKLCEVTPQTVSSWRNYDGPNGGQFPSKNAFKKLMKLEIICQVEVIIKKRKTPIREKGLPVPNVKMPRRRLKANYYY